MKITLTVAPPTAPRTGIALAAERSETTTPNRVAISVTRLPTTGADRFGDAALDQERGRVGGQPAEQRARRVIAEIRPPPGLRRAEREDLDAGKPRLERRQILAVMARDVGDGAQHQGRGHRQFDRQRGKPEEAR